MAKNSWELAALGTIAGACLCIIIVGGLFHPHTLAGSIARFVFSLHA